jgi:hypothetical protein
MTYIKKIPIIDSFDDIDPKRLEIFKKLDISLTIIFDDESSDRFYPLNEDEVKEVVQQYIQFAGLLLSNELCNPEKDQQKSFKGSTDPVGICTSRKLSCSKKYGKVFKTQTKILFKDKK